MGLKAKAKRAALGAAYIGPHGTKLRERRRQQKNRVRKALHAQYTTGTTDKAVLRK